MGLFSLLDAITGRPMHDVLANLPLADDIKMALLGNRNRLRDVLACVLAYEQAEWETFGLFAAKLRLDEGETADLSRGRRVGDLELRRGQRFPLTGPSPPRRPGGR